uniref:Uncharacterized protein n=1 Tax=Amphimedon queenslandica TaxID=400682 RepID=A0A1X7TPR1_AMPQE
MQLYIPLVVDSDGANDGVAMSIVEDPVLGLLLEVEDSVIDVTEVTGV